MPPRTTPRRPTRAAAGGSALRRLADAYGILPGYVSQTGERRVTADDTRVALLAAMGAPAEDAGAARRALEALAAARDAAPLSGARVIVLPDEPPPRRGRAGGERIAVPIPRGWGGAVEYALAVRSEGGEEHAARGRARPDLDGALSLALPAPLPPGYHELRLTMKAREGERACTQRLIVTPARCPAPAERLGGRRAFGLTANLYAVRSAANWGVGDFTDLAALVEYGAGVGAAFVGVNPLHALRNVGDAVSPYSPITRLFRNVVYLDVQAVPELAAAPDVGAAIADHADALAALRGARYVDYEAVMRLKRPLLEALHRAFAADERDTPRHRAYREYLREQGEPLERFAIFMALSDHLAERGAPDWRGWPAEYRDPRSPAVAGFARDHADAVALHRWLQFELDRQLAAAAARGRERGMPVGLYQDLAIGSGPDGSDAWAFPDLFVRGASVGAPPDPLAPQGQNWGLPPVHPRRLAAEGYAYWVQLVRGAMRHAGALRIDHVLGLFRQFWIPDGVSGDRGGYVRFPSEALFGILALEAARAGALVVGEDLGTVPPEVPPTLDRWRVLSSKVLYFERGAHGSFRAARDYPRTALATANTHDLATLAGFWRGSDVALRRSLGLLPTARAERAARGDRARDREALLELLAAEGIVTPEQAAAMDEETLRAAVHAFLRRTPSWLVGLSLEDLVGEAEPVNVPGVGPDRYPSWRRRLTTPLEALDGSAAVRRALGVEREGV